MRDNSIFSKEALKQMLNQEKKMPVQIGGNNNDQIGFVKELKLSDYNSIIANMELIESYKRKFAVPCIFIKGFDIIDGITHYKEVELISIGLCDNPTDENLTEMVEVTKHEV